MPGPIFLRGERVTLNVIGDDDVPFLYETINDPEVRAGLSFARPKTERAEREWVESVTDPDADDVHFLICDDGDSIGTVGLRNLDTRTGNAEIGCYLTPDAWGKGHATDAVQALLDHAFEQLRLHRVHARAVTDNEGSKRVLEKVGFEREGVMREHWYRDGDYQDVHVYGLLADEWRG
ncbi:GNAT family N-acetyltransferase [Haloarcula amylovorans]|uniref:GNAT family N-acetyltransferase n=1 Tax=Haloarcula amylovorans TaxID=2562280 RepID=UPI001076B38E|nr:GNAT family protein [Halomicroarcula amylolytica]